MRVTTLRGALPGRKPGTTESLTSSEYFWLSSSSISLRSTITLMCFLQGPTSFISTVCCNFWPLSSACVSSPFGSAAGSAAGSAVAEAASGGFSTAVAAAGSGGVSVAVPGVGVLGVSSVMAEQPPES